MKDFYYILTTDANCTSFEIQEAYERLLKSFHPDLNQNNKHFDNQYREICEAYEVLSNPEKRRQYDQKLKENTSSSFNVVQPKQQYFTKALDITFTIVLIFFTFVFGDYVIKSMSNSKATKVKKVAAAKTISFHLTKAHKKKHISKIKDGTSVPEITSTILKTDSIKQSPVIEHKDISVKLPSSDKNINSDKNATTYDNTKIDNNANDNNGFLYVTNLKSNQTGVINMRETDNFGAAIVKVIPTGSKIFVLEKGDVYYKIQFENSIGYVMKWTVEKK